MILIDSTVSLYCSLIYVRDLSRLDNPYSAYVQFNYLILIQLPIDLVAFLGHLGPVSL
jgi:hypothetical protein